MPLTSFQKQILKLLAESRSSESHVIGAVLINKEEDTPRYSKDIDICHDSEQLVEISARADEAVLLAADYQVIWRSQQPSFYRAKIVKGDNLVTLEWVFDSAFRFFPTIPDPDFGYRLHPFDSATNKMLALAGRVEAKDWVDMLHLHKTYMPIGVLAWAAAGKDDGMTPDMILEYANRFAKYRQVEIDELELAQPLNIRDLKLEWIEAYTEAKSFVQSLPVDELGCCYVGDDGQPVPLSQIGEFNTKAHYGSLKGAWPRIVNDK